MTISDSAYVRRFFSLYSQEEKDKVRGHAFYPTDYLSALLPTEVAYVGVVRSPYAGAKFTKIDDSKIKDIPQMLRVITARDIPRNASFGSRAALGQLILAENQVRYRGEPVALVVAASPEALQKGLKAVEIDWEPDAVSKNKREQTQTFHHKSGKAGSEKFASISLKFQFPSLQTRYLESESGWVEYHDEKLTFHIGSLLSESQRIWLAQVLDIENSKIFAKESPLGGQFGGRQQRELIVFLALAAYLTKLSVCLHFSPTEQDIGSYGYQGELSVSYDARTKKLLELKGKISIDAGSYAGNAGLVLQKTMEHASSLYDFKHIDLEGEVVLTSTHPRRSLKGEGLTAITWVTEQLVESAAKALEISPLEFRSANLRSSGAEHSDLVLQEVEKLEKPFRLLPIDRNKPIWDEKEIVGKGFGFQVFQPLTLKEFDQSEVSIELLHSGTFLIRTSNLTLDLHAKSALCEVAANVLHTHPKAFTVEGKMKEEVGKAARRETYPEFYYLAQATWNAANLLKKKLLAAGEKALNASEVILKEGAVVDQGMNRKMGYRELAFTHADHDVQVSFTLTDVGQPHGCSAGAVSRVSFHPLTGEMRVESVKVVLDAGPVFYQKGLEIQVETAVSWAMAALFSSEVSSEQPIPTPLDGPEEVTLFTLPYPIKDYSEEQPDFFGSRGITDVLMSVVLASLVNAIRDARGLELEEIPMPLEFMYPKKKHQTVHMLNFKR